MYRFDGVEAVESDVTATGSLSPSRQRRLEVANGRRVG